MNDNGLTDKENREYGKLSVIVMLALIVFLVSLWYLIIIFIMSLVYWYNHDTLTFVQLFKLYLNKYIIGFVIYVIDTYILKSSYKKWEVLKDKSDEYINKPHLVKDEDNLE
jgi:uncharacterized membrane protein